jgi:hypothetical protein
MWKNGILIAVCSYTTVVDGFIAYPLNVINLSTQRKREPPSRVLPTIRHYWQLHINPADITECSENLQDTDNAVIHSNSFKKSTSKREILRFAIPALGIYLCNPLLSNIDNAFVGRTVGTTGLAALSPATICTDQILFMFSFLGRATTGIVSRAYSSNTSSAEQGQTEGNIIAAREAASARKLMNTKVFLLFQRSTSLF